MANQIAGCGENSIGDAFQNRGYSTSGLLACVYGAYAGCLLQTHFYPKLISQEPINDTMWRQAGRILLTAGLVVPWVIIIIVLEVANVTSAYTLFFAKTLIPSTLIGFTLYYFADLVNMRLGLLEVPGDGAKGTASATKKNDDEVGLLAGDDQIAADDKTGA